MSIKLYTFVVGQWTSGGTMGQFGATSQGFQMESNLENTAKKSLFSKQFTNFFSNTFLCQDFAIYLKYQF